MIAHQGGWDELLLIVGPIVVVIALLRLAQRRVARSTANARPDDASDAQRSAAPPTH